MKSRLKEKNEAIAMRKQGFSYKEIMERINVSKSSLSGWFKFIDFSIEELHSLKTTAIKNSRLGRHNATVSNRERRQKRESQAIETATTLFNNYRNDYLFLIGISLYWAEGGKRVSSFQFTNSDPEMINFMIFWVKKYLKINEKEISIRLSTHSDFKDEKYEVLWSEITNIPVNQFAKTSYKPNRHGIYKKNPYYKGCVRLQIGGGMAVLRTMIGLQKALVQDLKMLY